MNVLDKTARQPAGQDEQDEADPEEKDKAPTDAPYVLIVWTPGGRLPS